MKLALLPTLAAALALSACDTIQVADTGEKVPQTAITPYSEWPTEFQGRTVEIVTPGGVTNVVNLAPDGTMTIIPELSTEVVKGTWGMKGEALCINFAPRGEECWNSAAVIAADGDFVRLVSDRGTRLSVRLLSEAEEELIDRGG